MLSLFCYCLPLLFFICCYCLLLFFVRFCWCVLLCFGMFFGFAFVICVCWSVFGLVIFVFFFFLFFCVFVSFCLFEDTIFLACLVFFGFMLVQRWFLISVFGCCKLFLFSLLLVSRCSYVLSVLLFVVICQKETLQKGEVSKTPRIKNAPKRTHLQSAVSAVVLTNGILCFGGCP